MKSMISVDKDYKKLVARLPLVPIENDKHLAIAHAIIVELAGKAKMTRGESQYFDVLSKLTGDYEKDIFPTEPMAPHEAFAYILEESRLSQGQMGHIIGCRQGRVSEILAGVRELSKEQIARLSDHFKVSANLFLPISKKKVA
jgi:HTH-type transcriptional regulator / antitoxin HigA